MKNVSLPGILTAAVLLTFGAFWAFDPDFQAWLGKAYDAFATGELAEIRDFLEDYKEYGYLILLGAFLFQMFLFVVPSVMVMTLCVLMYGPFWGAVMCIAGIFVASTVAYFLGKMLSTVTLDKIIGKSSREHMSDFLENYGFWTVAIFRLSPFLSNDAVSFVAGLVKMNYWRFIAATLAGITPLSILIAWVGKNTAQMETGLIIASVIGLVGLAFYIYVDKYKIKKKKKED